MNKVIDQQILKLLKERVIEKDFDVDRWNTEVPYLKKQLKNTMKDQLVSSEDFYADIATQTDNSMNLQLEKIEIFQKFSKFLQNKTGASNFVLKHMKEYLDDYLDFYELRKVKASSCDEITGKYTDIAKLYHKSLSTHDNYKHFRDIVDYIEDTLNNRDLYSERMLQLLTPISQILDSDDDDDIDIIKGLSNSFQ